MNAPTRLATLLVGNATRLRTSTVALALSLAVAATLAACSGIGAGSQAPHVQAAQSASSDRHCADIWMENLVSKAPVPGVFACQDDTEQARAQAVGVTDDASLHNILALSDSTATFIGADGHVFAYGVHSGTTTAVWIIWTDADGRIAHFSYTNSL